MKCTFLADKRYLNLPVTEHGALRSFTLSIDGKPVHGFLAKPAEREPDYYVAVDLARFQGKEITVTMEGDEENAYAERMILDDRRTGHERIYREELRPRFHYSAICGWLNDPNGLLYYRGKWFLFAQINPYYRWCCNMHWLYATSPDLFHWTDHGIALHTDPAYQKFSGSGIVDEGNISGLKEGDDDPILLFYTDWGADARQSLAYSTDGGKTFREYAHNPILPQVAPGNRDPKVIPRPDGKGFYMALYLKDNDYALFSSTDLLHWEQSCVLTLPGCLECPDIYEIALDGDPDNTRMVFSCAGGQYLVGRIEQGRFLSETEIQSTYCAPFYTVYAPQSFYGAPDGRRVQIICSSNETMLPGEAFGKFMTLPCELTLHSTEYGGMTLFSKPVRELRALELDVREHPTFTLSGTRQIETPKSGLFRLEFSIPADYKGELLLRVFDLTIPYRGSDHTVEHRGHRFTVHPRGEWLDFDLVVDRCSAELFLGEGEIYLPTVQPFYLDRPALILESSEAVEIKDARVAALPDLLPFSEV